MSKEIQLRPLNFACDEANDLIFFLKRHCSIDDICVVGALRRRVELVSAIVLLVASSDRTSIIEVLETCTLIKDIFDYSVESFEAITQEGFLLKLVFCEPDFFGYEKFIMSASESFVIDFFQDNQITKESCIGFNEASIFELADLPYVPATLREDYSRFLSLKNSTQIDVLCFEDIKADLHIHSTYSDGQNSIELIADRAKKLGYSYVGISDHSQSLHVARGLSVRALKDKKKKILQLNQEYSDFVVLCGVEVDILADGRLDYPDEVLSNSDYVIGSVHVNTSMDYSQMTQRMLMAIKSGKIDILGHPTGRMFDVRDGLEFDIDAIMAACAEYRVAMEISGYTKRLDLNDTLAAKAKTMGCLFACGTDAHYVDCLDSMKYAVWIAQRAWLSKKDIINCLAVDDFREFIRNRRLLVNDE